MRLIHLLMGPSRSGALNQSGPPGKSDERTPPPGIVTSRLVAAWPLLTLCGADGPTQSPRNRRAWYLFGKSTRRTEFGQLIYDRGS